MLTPEKRLLQYCVVGEVLEVRLPRFTVGPSDLAADIAGSLLFASVIVDKNLVGTSIVRSAKPGIYGDPF